MDPSRSPGDDFSASNPKYIENLQGSTTRDSDDIEYLGVSWRLGGEQEKNEVPSTDRQGTHISQLNPTVTQTQDPVNLEQPPHGHHPPGYPYAGPPPANAFHHQQFGPPMGHIPPHEVHHMAMYQNHQHPLQHQPHHHQIQEHPTAGRDNTNAAPKPQGTRPEKLRHPTSGMQRGHSRQHQGSEQTKRTQRQSKKLAPKQPTANSAAKVLAASNKTQEILVERIECPHPKDVLFPISGFQLWAGNVRYRRVVNNRRDDFLKSNADGRLDIARAVQRSVIKENGRFLRAIELSPLEKQGETNPMVICRTNWQEVDEETSLEQIIKLFNSHPEAREQSRLRREARSRRRRERRVVLQHAVENTTKPSKVGFVGGPPPGPLMMLYYRPARRRYAGSQVTRGTKRKSLSDLLAQDHEMYSSDSSTESVSTLESSPPLPTKPAPRKKPGPKKRPASKSAPRSPAKKKAVKSLKPPKSPKAPKQSPPSVPPHVTLHPLGAALDLPKGVTVRPSGKWVSLARGTPVED